MQKVCHYGILMQLLTLWMLSIIMYFSFRATNQRLDSASVLRFCLVYNCIAETGLLLWQTVYV
jgi:hypothetical protein